MEFIEKQQLKLWWLYILLGIETIIVCSLMFLSKDKMTWQEITSSHYLPIFAILLPYLIVYVVTKNSFTIKIDVNGINYRYWPFARNKFLAWQQIEKLYIRKFDALGEYGGWGYRYRLWFKFKDKAYIFNDANLGLQIELANNKKILFSTSKLEELTLFLINIKRTQHIGAIETDVRER